MSSQLNISMPFLAFCVICLWSGGAVREGSWWNTRWDH